MGERELKPTLENEIDYLSAIAGHRGIASARELAPGPSVPYTNVAQALLEDLPVGTAGGIWDENGLTCS